MIGVLSNSKADRYPNPKLKEIIKNKKMPVSISLLCLKPVSRTVLMLDFRDRITLEYLYIITGYPVIIYKY